MDGHQFRTDAKGRLSFSLATLTTNFACLAEYISEFEALYDIAMRTRARIRIIQAGIAAKVLRRLSPYGREEQKKERKKYEEMQIRASRFRGVTRDARAYVKKKRFSRTRA